MKGIHIMKYNEQISSNGVPPLNRNTPQLETKRLLLRKFTEDDIESLFLILREEETNTFLPWFPVKSMAEAADFFEKRFADNYNKPCAYNYAICLKSDDIPIGYVNVNMDDSHDLGYGLRQKF